MKLKQALKRVVLRYYALQKIGDFSGVYFDHLEQCFLTFSGFVHP